MPNTPTYSFPYPAPSDLVKDGPTNFQNLATAVEDVIETLPVRTGDLLVNGSMRVWQYGTSATGITSAGYYTADRWRLLFGTTSGTWRMDQIVGAANLPQGASAGLRIECTTARNLNSDNSLRLLQPIEGITASSLSKGTANAREATVSFSWRSNRTGIFNVELRDNVNSRFVSKAFTYSTANVWQNVTLTFPADTTGTLNFDTTKNLELQFWILAGSNFTGSPRQETWSGSGNRATGQVTVGQAIADYVEVTNVQLVPGPFSKSFVQRPFSDLLLECQRYYYRFDNGITGVDLSVGRATSTTVAHFSFSPGVPMRAAPTSLTQSGTAAHYGIVSGTTVTNCSAVPALLTSTQHTLNWSQTVASGLTLGHAVGARMVNAAATLAFSAELI